MLLYHGSPKQLSVLRPQQAKGRNAFENQKAVFLCKSFDHAALYAIGKSLKGKTTFAVTPTKLIILGELQPSIGYVYEVETDDFLVAKGDQYASLTSLKPLKRYTIKPEEYRKSIIHAATKEELLAPI